MAARVLRSAARCAADRGAPHDDRHEGRGDPSHRRALAGELRRRAGAERREAPRRGPPEGLHGRPRRRAAGDDRLRRTQRRGRADRRRRAARRRDARRHRAEAGEAARRPLRRHDPRGFRARARAGRRAQRGDHGARRDGARRGVGCGHAARRRAARLHRGARARDHAQPARLPRCLRGRARAARRDRRRAGGRAVGRGPRLGGRAGRHPRARRVPGPVSALHRARVRGRHDRALAAVAESAL